MMSTTAKVQEGEKQTFCLNKLAQSLYTKSFLAISVKMSMTAILTQGFKIYECLNVGRHAHCNRYRRERAHTIVRISDGAKV